jgi:hypothetical protein
MPLQFEWALEKARRNLRKQGVSFEEASTIFNDEMFITVVDDEHSGDEERYISIGLSIYLWQSYRSSAYRSLGQSSHY